MYEPNRIKIGLMTLKEWINIHPWNTPSTTNPKDEEIVYDPGKDGNVSMLKQVKRPNPLMMMMKFEKLVHLVGFITRIHHN